MDTQHGTVTSQYHPEEQSNFHCVASLKPPPELTFVGNLEEVWGTFKQRFTLYMKATNTSSLPDDQKVALLLTVAGPEALDIYNSFELSETDCDNYELVMEKFTAYCAAKKNETFERFLFKSRVQQPHETELVTDRERLLSDCELTLQKAISVCQSAEQTRKQIDAMHKDSSQKVVNEARKFQSEETKESSVMFQANSTNGPFSVQPQLSFILPVSPQVGHGQTLTEPFYQAFLKGQPKTLGTVQITLVILHVALSAVLIATMGSSLSITIISGVTFWGSIFYLISGALSVAAEIKQSRCLVRGSLSINIISCIAALLEISLISADFNINRYSSCQSYGCWSSSYPIVNIRTVSLGFLLFVSLLQFSLSLSLAIFGCKSLNHESIREPQVCWINNNYNTILTTTGQFPPGNEITAFIPEKLIDPTNPGKQL
ncbi:uncharacterized protein LOC128640004 isoform X1 [Bombina bombina]|uniref:uncharacterized protein LOC128640004 isoform X1 n=1 Tax=Bombina bombina TaxID=8345 RepID=UPI00235ABFE1|nr:uncharacterized protein LOC128640004 isoform X1 [Bombina bombina]